MAAIPGESELERLVNRSRLIGSDASLVLHGGGNTSTKLVERDHLGRERRVLRIKGSGADLATAGTGDFPGLWLDELLPLRERTEMSDDEMVAYLERSLVDPGARRPSIETLLHAFLPAAHVDHVHADVVCALANAPDPQAAVRDVLGTDVAVVDYLRPGFELSRRVAEHAEARAIVLAHHGLVTWGETHEESYALTLELVGRAREFVGELGHAGSGPEPDPRAVESFLLRLRGRLSAAGRQVLVTDRGQRAIADRDDVEQVAALRGTPDHMLRIGARSCVVALEEDAGGPIEAFEAGERERTERYRGDEELPVQSPAPRIFLVPGLGAVAAGPDARSAGMRAEISWHSHNTVAATIDRFGGASWLDDRDVHEFQCWPLELYKLTQSPPPPELSGHVSIVTGAASGIGREIAIDLARRGAHLVLADIDEAGLDETGARIERSVTVGGDLTEARLVDRLVQTAVATFGGLDSVVLNAGVASIGMLGEIDEAEWRRSIEVNLTAHFLLTRRVWPVLKEQGMGGSLVYVASKNAFAPGAGFGSYSVAKAGLLQLMRIAALEGGAHGIRANALNPDAIFSGSRLWSDEVRTQRAKAHGVSLDELESFYASRSLLGRVVTGDDVAQAVAFLVSDRSQATTGAVLPIDGGVAAAFPR